VAPPYIPDAIVPTPTWDLSRSKVHNFSWLAKRLRGWVRACNLVGNCPGQWGYTRIRKIFGTRGLLIPTSWGLIWDFTFRPGRGSQLFPREMHPAAWLWRPGGSAEGDNFPDLWMNSGCRIFWQHR
jgi:hypothetical protein